MADEDLDETEELEDEDDLEDADLDEDAAEGEQADAAVEPDGVTADAPDAALPGDAELGADEPAATQAVAQPAPTVIEQLAQQLHLPPAEIARRLFQSVVAQPVTPAPAAEPAEDDDEPVTKADARRMVAAERQKILQEAVQQAESRVQQRMSNADIERMVDAELDRYGMTQRFINKAVNPARDDIKKLVYDELGTMPGWGADAIGNIRRAAKKKIGAQMAASGRLPATKKAKREAGDVQPSKTPGAVGRVEKEEAEDDESDNLISRRGAAKRVGLIARILKTG